MAQVKKTPHKRDRHFIKEWLASIGKRQEDVADELGVSQSAISRLLSRKAPYNQDVLERLARRYGWTPADLLRGPPGQSKTDKEREAEIIADTAQAMAQLYKIHLADDVIDYLIGTIGAIRAQREALVPPETPSQKATKDQFPGPKPMK